MTFKDESLREAKRYIICWNNVLRRREQEQASTNKIVNITDAKIEIWEMSHEEIKC